MLFRCFLNKKFHGIPNLASRLMADTIVWGLPILTIRMRYNVIILIFGDALDYSRGALARGGATHSRGLPQINIVHARSRRIEYTTYVNVLEISYKKRSQSWSAK